MKQVNSGNFKDEVVNFKGIVVADFFAKWCNPCKILSPLLEGMDKANKDTAVKFVKIDVDEEQELSGLFGVMSIPTVVFFKDGKVVNQRVGVSSAEDYQYLIDGAKNHSRDDAKAGSKTVTVFTTPTCPYCHMAKEYLKEKKVEFKDVDVSKDQESAMKMVQRSGQMGVPQLWIGDQVVIGFNKPQIDMLLNL